MNFLRTTDTTDTTDTTLWKPGFRLTTSEFPRLPEALRIPEMFTCCYEIGGLVNRAKKICVSLPFQTNIFLFCNDT